MERKKMKKLLTERKWKEIPIKLYNTIVYNDRKEDRKAENGMEGCKN
jgi:hypothetical protein